MEKNRQKYRINYRYFNPTLAYIILNKLKSLEVLVGDLLSVDFSYSPATDFKYIICTVVSHNNRNKSDQLK